MAVITNSTLVGDLRLAAALSRSIYELLYDRAALRTSTAVSYLGSVNQTGSAVMRVRQYGVGGYTAFTAVGEGVDVANTNPIISHADCTISRGALRYDMGDLAMVTMPGEGMDPTRIAENMVAGFDQWLNELITTAAAGLGTDVSPGSGVDLDLDSFFDAIYVLEIANNSAPFHSILAPVQVSDLQQSLRGAAGTVSFMPATAELVSARGQGYCGSLLGVDIWKSDSVPTANAGADREGSMVAGGCLGWAAGIPVPPMSGDFTTYGDVPLLVEFQRDSSACVTEIVGNAYSGACIVEDARGVSITSDA